MPIPSPTGASVHVSEVAANLRRLGHEVHIVARRTGRNEKAVEEVDGVVVHRVYRWIVVPERPGRRGAMGRESTSTAHRAYHLYLRTVFALYVSLVAAFIVRRNGLGRVLERETAFGAGGMASMLSRRPMVLEIVGPRYSRLSVRRSSTVLYYTESMLRDWVDRSKCRPVPGGVDSSIFHPDAKGRSQTRRALGIEDDIILVGYLGSFQPWHGVSSILQALPSILSTQPRVRGLFVGPASEPYRDQAKSIGVEGSCLFVGSVPYGQAPSYLNAFDIAIAPYDPQSDPLRRKYGMGWPLKVLEYMACEKPVVATDVPPTGEVVKDGVTGLLVPPGDPRALSEATVRLIEDPQLAREIATRGRHVVEESYSWRSVVQTISEALESAR